MNKTLLLLSAASCLLAVPAHAQQTAPAGVARLAEARRLDPLASLRRAATGYRRIQTLEQRFPGGTTATNRRQTYSNFTARLNKPRLTQYDSLDGNTVLPLRQFRRRYNALEQITTDSTWAWTNLQRYVPIRVSTYTYNGQDSLAQELVQVSRSGTLTPFDRLTYTYDAASRRLTRILYEGYNNNSWGGYAREEYFYDAQGRVSRIDVLASALGGPFEPFARTLLAYDSQSRLQSAVFQLANAASSTGYDNLVQTVVVYDASGRVASRQGNEWRNNAWQPLDQTLLTYDPDDNVDTETIQRYANNRFSNFERFVYSYQRVLGTYAARLQAGLAVLPNPSAGFAEACFALPAPGPAILDVTDALGRTVRTVPVPAAGTAPQRVPLAGLPAGLYVVRLTAAGQSQQTKLLVR